MLQNELIAESILLTRSAIRGQQEATPFQGMGPTSKSGKHVCTGHVSVVAKDSGTGESADCLAICIGICQASAAVTRRRFVLTRVRSIANGLEIGHELSGANSRGLRVVNIGQWSSSRHARLDQHRC